MSKGKVVKKFIAILERAETFAESSNSIFREHFRLAHFILISDEFNFRLSVKEAGALLHSYGFSDFAEDMCRRIFEDIQSDEELLYSEEQKKALLAYELTNIFGGMGSWNDASYSDKEVQDEFLSLTDDLKVFREKLVQEYRIT